MKTSSLILFFKSHIDTFTRKDGSVVAAHDDKRQAATEPEIHQHSSRQTHKDWKSSAPHKGKVNGWDLFHDDVQDQHVLMTPHSSARFKSEAEARDWGGRNKANSKGPFKG